MGFYINRGERLEVNRFADISAILSPSAVRDIYDDDNCGEPDFEPLLWLEETAEDMFESGVLGAFQSLDALRANPCRTCARIVGEFVQALAAQRFPRAYGRDFERLMKIARDSVDRIRMGKDRLAAQGPPNPPSNVGGAVFAGSSAEALDPSPSVFSGPGDWGSF